jgi:predicted metal-dependent hydrolase
MPVKVVLLPDLGNVTFSQNHRSRRMKLSVRPNQKILVSFPPFVTFSQATKFAEKHKNWIISQKQKFLNSAGKITLEFPVKTRFHTVNIQTGGEKFSVKQKKFEITIGYPQNLSISDEKFVAYFTRIMESIYGWEARRYLPVRLTQLAAQHNLTFNKVSIRNNISNWGSCSSRNNISLNLKLMKLPDHLIDFILLHELAHTRVKNHGPEFWKLLDNLSNGQAQKLTKELKLFSAA